MVCEDVVPRIEDVTIDCRFDIGDKNDFLLQKISNHIPYLVHHLTSCLC